MIHRGAKLESKGTAYSQVNDANLWLIVYDLTGSPERVSICTLAHCLVCQFRTPIENGRPYGHVYSKTRFDSGTMPLALSDGSEARSAIHSMNNG